MLQSIELLRIPWAELDAYLEMLHGVTPEDLAAGIEWGTLCDREFAFGMKLATPYGADFIMLMALLVLGGGRRAAAGRRRGRCVGEPGPGDRQVPGPP